jgi:prepilin-type N-terminal cleavage/methylation domain-containing protein
MTVRRGFTLIEVLIALVLTSVVVVLAYSTLRAGADVEQRVTAAREADQNLTVMRAVLTDALRHAVESSEDGTRAMQTVTDAQGHTTSFAFLSRGVQTPHGGTAPWNVALISDSIGITLDARSLQSARSPLRLSVRNAQSMTVRFKGRDAEDWVAEWTDPTRMPTAVEVRFLDAQNRDVMAPVLARLAPVAAS